MAGEITLNGQFAKYGGPQITLLGSTIGNAVVSILAREGTGTARGWKIFDPTKADFLNTKKILYPGDDVLVNAKVLPMDFPLQATGGDSKELYFEIEPGVQSKDYVFTEGRTGQLTGYAVFQGLIDGTPKLYKNGTPFTLGFSNNPSFAIDDVLTVEATGNPASNGGYAFYALQ